jgi:membrane-associated phospholipid phosphatase
MQATPRPPTFSPPRSLSVRRLIAFSLAFVIVLLALIWCIDRFTLLPGDLEMSISLQNLAPPWLSQLLFAVSLLGWTPWYEGMVALMALVVTLWLGWRWAAYLVGLVILQAVINSLLKISVARPRPTDPPIHIFIQESGYAFPSGHVMFYTVFFGFLLYLFWRFIPNRWGRIFVGIIPILLIALIGLSRIYLGAHWLSDVLGGYAVGLYILFLAIPITSRFFSYWE